MYAAAKFLENWLLHEKLIHRMTERERPEVRQSIPVIIF